MHREWRRRVFINASRTVRPATINTELYTMCVINDIISRQLSNLQGNNMSKKKVETTEPEAETEFEAQGGASKPPKQED